MKKKQLLINLFNFFFGTLCFDGYTDMIWNSFCSPGHFLKSIQQLKGSFQTMWSSIGWRCISKCTLACVFFMPTEVQDLSEALIHILSSTWLWAVTPVMLYKCHASWDRQLLYRRQAFGIVEEKALCGKTETPGTMVLYCSGRVEKEQKIWGTAFTHKLILKVLLQIFCNMVFSLNYLLLTQAHPSCNLGMEQCCLQEVRFVHFNTGSSDVQD